MPLLIHIPHIAVQMLPIEAQSQFLVQLLEKRQQDTGHMLTPAAARASGMENVGFSPTHKAMVSVVTQADTAILSIIIIVVLM